MQRQLLIYVTLILTACSGSRATIEGTVDPKIYGDDSAWCYLYTTCINDRYIADSCQLKNHRFSLSSELPYETDYRLFFPDAHKEHIFAMRPGNRLKIHLDAQTQSKFLNIPESYSTTAYQKVYFTCWENERIYKLLSDSLLLLSAESSEYANLKDSLLQLKTEQRRKFVALINDEEIYKSPTACDLVCLIAQQDGLTADTSDSLKKVLLTRFSKERLSLSFCLPEDEIPPTSHEGYLAENRIRYLKNLPPVPEVYEQQPTKTAASSDYVKPTPYQVGDIIDSELFARIDNSASGFNSLTSPYILIDFWASWCQPCCKEIPELIVVKTKFRDQLSVYSVSLDHYSDQWNNALNKYGMHQCFTNVLLPRTHKDYRYLTDKFDAHIIPHNLLLDKDRRIIAIDFRGEQLVEKMKELTEK